MIEPAPPSQSAAADTGPLTPAQVRWLKIAIVVMAIMIVAGILGVVARMFYLASTRSPQASRASAATTIGTIAPEAKLQLPSGAIIKSMTMDGARLALQYDAPSGAGIAIVDVASGRVVSRWRIEPEPPR